MAPKTYLDDSGNPITSAPKQYLDDNGEPISAAPAAASHTESKQPSAFSRFKSSAVAPVVGAVSGAYHAITDPPRSRAEEILQQALPGGVQAKRMLVDPAIAQGENAVFDARLGRYSEAIGHGLAAVIPGVGPWAAQFAETEGKQLGSGDVAGAAGTLAGNAALALAPKAVGKGMAALRATSESFRKGAQASVGAGERAVRHTVAGEAEKASAAREAVLKKNKAADEATLMERGKVEEKNAGLEEKNAAAGKEAEQVNQQLARRTEAQKELETVSSNMDVAVEKARHDALEIGNKKYSGVNKALDGVLSDPETIGEALGNAEDALRGSTRDTTLLKDMTREYLGEVDKDGMPKEGKEGRTPAYEDLQGDYSRLGRELSKGTLPGDVFHAYDQLHEALGKEMQRLADSKGQGAELKVAREYWRRMKQTFGKSSDAVTNRAAKAVRSANPSLLKGQSNEYQLRLLSSFDPKIGELASRSASLREELASLPKKASAASPGTRAEFAEPHATTPTERPEVSTRAIREDLLDRWSRGEEGLNKWQVRALVAGPIGGLIGFVLGHGEAGAGVGYGIGTAIGPAMIARLVERPGMREWLTRPPTGELETLQKLPNADRLRITDGLKQIATAAQAKGIPISTSLASVLGLSSVQGPKTRQLQEMRRGNPIAP